MREKDYVGLSDASSAFNDEAKGENLVAADEREARGEEREDDEDGEELELGLSLGAKKVAGGGNSRAGAWVDYGGGCCRILTANVFSAAVGSRVSPMSSSSSSVSSSDGAKPVVKPDVAAGSANPPSQVVVGWPPIGAFRFNSLVNQAKENIPDDEAIHNKKHNHNSSSKNNNNDDECINNKNREKKAGSLAATRFVKVNMDGDPIGRKVDLDAHRSYEALVLALEAMFHMPTSLSHSAKASRLLYGSSEFALTYEDKDGDWLLVGDVPWGMFLDTVKRLRLMRTSDANGLAPWFQSSAGGLLRNEAALT